MTHRPIIIHNLSLSFGAKNCFEGFSASIRAGQRVAITGANGQGKSMLLKIIQGHLEPSAGEIIVPPGLKFAQVEQTITEFASLSGGQRFLRKLSRALALDPDVLCLDEPTNHLDHKNRSSFLALLENYKKTLLVVSHDLSLLRNNFDALWHIEDQKIYQYKGSYDDFMRNQTRLWQERFERKNLLRRKKAQAHEDLMRDQMRAKKKKIHGEKKYDGDKLALRSAQGRGQMTTNKNRKHLAEEKGLIKSELLLLRMPEVINPSFAFNTRLTSVNKPVLAIKNGSCGYEAPLIKAINLQIKPGEKLAICGQNGCGKTTLAKAIMNDRAITRSGEWLAPCNTQIGYLDQHYDNLNLDMNSWEHIQKAAPSWTKEECRQHLNKFLIRKNEEITTKAKNLSEGEKARLSLAILAAYTPSLLILDEITNNLDINTREHVVQVLKVYPGALLLISHDEDFLKALDSYNIFLETTKKPDKDP